MVTDKLRLVAKTRPSTSSTTSADSYLDCEYEKPKYEALSANVLEGHQSSGTSSYADALKGPQAPKAGSLVGDADNEPHPSKTTLLSRESNDISQSPQPLRGSSQAISLNPCDHQPYRRHINPWIATLQYRVFALVNSIEIAQANALPFRNHADLGEPLPFVMDMRFSASLVRSNMRLVAEWIHELQIQGLPEYEGLEDIVDYLYFFSGHWGLRNHDPQLVRRIQCLVSYLVG